MAGEQNLGTTLHYGHPDIADSFICPDEEKLIHFF